MSANIPERIKIHIDADYYYIHDPYTDGDFRYRDPELKKNSDITWIRYFTGVRNLDIEGPINKE
jgi:hypothetical protein